MGSPKIFHINSTDRPSASGIIANGPNIKPCDKKHRALGTSTRLCGSTSDPHPDNIIRAFVIFLSCSFMNRQGKMNSHGTIFLSG